MDYSNLIIRWTFGETKARPISLQAFDMLECSILYATLLFPQAQKYIIYNSLNSDRSQDKLKIIAENKATLIEARHEWNNEKKNSFWKYEPLRIDIDKYELILDCDVILWKVPKLLKQWISTNSLLINSDWNGRNYGVYNKNIPEELHLNAGILGFPPGFAMDLPLINDLPDKFHSEQGFIVNEFIHSSKPLIKFDQDHIFQSNAESYLDKKMNNIINRFFGGHFCGCNYCHFAHWDKYYKDEIWANYYNLLNETK